MKKLSLKKESLTQLGSDDLASVVGGVTIGCTITLNLLCVIDKLGDATVPTIYCTQAAS